MHGERVKDCRYVSRGRTDGRTDRHRGMMKLTAAFVILLTYLEAAELTHHRKWRDQIARILFHFALS